MKTRFRLKHILKDSYWIYTNDEEVARSVGYPPPQKKNVYRCSHSFRKRCPKTVVSLKLWISSVVKPTCQEVAIAMAQFLVTVQETDVVLLVKKKKKDRVDVILWCI